MRALKRSTEIRQEEIARAALDAIGEEGVQALSIAGIAARVGLAPSAVYRHYAGKDEVLDAVLELLHTRLMKNAAAVRVETTLSLERLNLLMFKHIRMLSESRAFPALIFSDALFSSHRKRKARVRNTMTQYLNEVEKIIKEGQLEGTISKKTDPKTASTLFLGMILPATVLQAATDGKFDVNKHAKGVWKIYERGIKTLP